MHRNFFESALSLSWGSTGSDTIFDLRFSLGMTYHYPGLDRGLTVAFF